MNDTISITFIKTYTRDKERNYLKKSKQQNFIKLNKWMCLKGLISE